MGKLNHFAAIVGFICVVQSMTGSSHARAAEQLPPIATSSQTGRDMAAAALQFNRATFGEAYEKVGKRDPKWDATARAFLDRIAERLTNASYSDWYASDVDTSLAAVCKLADAATDAGCDDPLVLYSKSELMSDAGDIAGATRLMDRAVPALLKSDYPAVRKYFADARYAEPEFHHADRKAALGIIAQRSTLAVAMLAEKWPDPLHRRYLMDIFRDRFGDMPAPAQRALIDQATKASIDAWELDLLTGINEIKFAWEARGGGYTNTVTAGGWKQFGDHLANARTAFVAAINLEPTYPEPSANMVIVSMGMNDGSESTRGWFDRAVAAQIDYMPAWSNYGYALLPRWEGTHQMMYALGCEAMQTRRFDTAVPMFLLTMLQNIARDSGANYDFHRQPGVWLNVQTVCDGYLNSPFANMDADFWKTRKAAFAYRCGEYAEAATLLDELKDNARPVAAEWLDVRVADMTEECRALTSDAAGQLETALASERAGDFFSAEAIYDEVLSRIKQEHPARRYCELHQRQCAFAQSLKRGETAEVPLKSEADFACFQGADADWKLNDGVLTLTAAGNSEHVVRHAFAVPSGSRVEFEWSYTKDRGRCPEFELTIQNTLDLGEPVVCVLSKLAQDAVQIGGRKRVVPGGWATRITTEPDTWHKWSVERHWQQITLDQDGVRICSATSDLLQRGQPLLGWRVKAGTFGNTVKIRNIVVQPVADNAS